MAKGLPKSIIKKYGISKKAWRAFRGRKARRPKSTSRTPKTRRKGVRRMVRRRRRKGGKSFTQQAFKWIRVGAIAAPAAVRLAEHTRHGNMETTVYGILEDYTGFYIPEGNFDLRRLARGWGPYLGAVLTTYGIPKIASIIRRL